MTKVSVVEGLTPRAMEVGGSEGSSNEGVRLKKELGLMNGVAIIVGVIVGSGIFASPNLALKHAGSKGMALAVWVISGVISMVGALCYAELGTMIPKSGGDYAYIGEAFGELPAFLYLWVALFILVPTGNAITALIFAENILKPGWPECDPPSSAVCLIAAVVTCFLTALNCFNVKWVTRVQDSFTIAKILALLVTFFTSIWYLFARTTENLEFMMQGTVTNPADISIAIYMGLFSYSGWNYLNFVTEELKDPYKNLPRAICLSMPVVILVYALTNFAYFAVLTNPEILATEAVAVTYSEKILGVMSWIMPVFVALCTFGSLNGAIYASSRVFFVGARNGHLPLAISLIDVRRLTPVPSLIFMCIVTLALISINNVEDLVVYLTGVELLFILCSVAGLLWLRHTHPDVERPIKVHLSLPISFFLICTALVILAGIRKPANLCVGLVLIALGVPVFYLFVRCKNKPKWLENACISFNVFCSKLFLSMPEDSKEL